MTTKIFASLACAAVLLLSNAAFAGSTTGTIKTFHLNGAERYAGNGRGVCVRMTPNISGSGWACLYRSKTVSKDMFALLFEGFTSGGNCSVTYDIKDSDGHWEIASVTCTR